MELVIAIDAMGGDHGPSEIVPAALDVLTKHQQLHLILVGREAAITTELKQHSAINNDRIQLLHAPDVIAMDEAPAAALRHKKQSSMRLSIEQVHTKKAAACVSAGNTGALMAISRAVLKMLPGIERPAICKSLPGQQGSTHVLDLGANVDSTAEQLLQFAIMGSQLASATRNKENPTIGLLNVGKEANKGNERVKNVSALLAKSHLNYVGYVEGDAFYTGAIDVIVCDGFVGNIVLKASEGLTQFLYHHVALQFNHNIYTKFSALLAKPVLTALKNKIDPSRYNGASLLGLKGIVVKSHGGAKRLSFVPAIEEAMIEVQNNIPAKINAKLDLIFATESA